MTDDRCPGILRWHPAQDGRLARVRLPGGRIGADGLDAIAAAAALGSGLVELTSRASLQIRGLRADDPARLAKILAAGGLLPSAAHDRVRNVLASPLGGRHPRSVSATDAVVSAIDDGLRGDARLAALPGRFLFAVDDGSGVLVADSADVVMRAERSGPRRPGSPAFRLWLSGRATSLVTSPQAATDLALEAAREFMLVRAAQGIDGSHVRDLAGGAEAVARRLGAHVLDPARRAARGPDAGGSRTRRPGIRAGVQLQRDGRFAVTALPPLGRLDRAGVERLATLARSWRQELRLSPSRTLTVVDVAAVDVDDRIATLERMDLIVAPDSGWLGLSACAGLGACANARLDVRAGAALRVPARARRAAAPVEHWSACGRRCGEPANASVAVVAEDDSRLAITLDGRRRLANGTEHALSLLTAEEAAT